MIFAASKEIAQQVGYRDSSWPGVETTKAKDD